MTSKETQFSLQLEMLRLDEATLIAQCDELLTLHELVDGDCEWDVFDHILNRAYDRSKFDPNFSFIIRVNSKTAATNSTADLEPLAAFLISNREAADGLKRYAQRSIYISKGAVHPLFRRQGLYARIMYATLSTAKALVPNNTLSTTPIAFWKTTHRSRAAIRLYESIGAVNVVPRGVNTCHLRDPIKYDAADNERFAEWSQGHRVFEVSKAKIDLLLAALQKKFNP